MASSTLPWQKLWHSAWGLIPSPETDGRLLVALDDYINPKIGKSIFGCETIFDHAAKANQSQYPWAQNIVAVGLLKQGKGRWACLFLDFRFYLAKKTIDAEKDTAKIKDAVVPFQTKLQLAGQMLIDIGHYFPTSPLLAVTDSWFGNQSLWRQVRKVLADHFHILSRLRCNNVLYAQPDVARSGQRGRRRKYGKRLGSVTDMASEVRQKTKIYTVNLYGKRRDVCAYDAVVMLKTFTCPVRVVWVFRKTQWLAMFTTDLETKIESSFKELKQDIGSRTSQCRNAQVVNNHLQFCMMASTITWIYGDRLKANQERRYKVKGRTSFAFSDVRRHIAEAALNESFDKVCPKPGNPTKNSLAAVLLRMVA